MNKCKSYSNCHIILWNFSTYETNIYISKIVVYNDQTEIINLQPWLFALHQCILSSDTLQIPGIIIIFIPSFSKQLPLPAIFTDTPLYLDIIDTSISIQTSQIHPSLSRHKIHPCLPIHHPQWDACTPNISQYYYNLASDTQQHFTNNQTQCTQFQKLPRWVRIYQQINIFQYYLKYNAHRIFQQ